MRNRLTRRARAGLAGAGALLVLGCATLQERAQRIQYTQPAGVALLSETQIRRDIVGNTLSGHSRQGPSYAEYYQPDGTIRGMRDDNQHYRGQWAVAGPVWCARYGNSSGCYVFSRDGDRINRYAPDGTAPLPAQLLPGNARGL